jgi:hypothetical protein
MKTVMGNRQKKKLICRKINKIRFGKRKLRDRHLCNYQSRLSTQHSSMRGHRWFPTTVTSMVVRGWMQSGAEGGVMSYISSLLSGVINGSQSP